MTFGKSKFNHQAKDQVFYLDKKDRDINEDIITKEQSKRELRAFKDLKANKFIISDKSCKEQFVENFKVSSYGNHSVKEFGAGFVFTKTS